jgi:DnaJ-class molecular chaperone
MTVLGVESGATLEQVAVAYRHMAQMYHPDKTTGLGPELQQLADQRMKEINSAHQTVKQYLEHA